MKKIFLLAIAGAFIFAACKKDEVNGDDNGINPSSEYTLIKKDTTDANLIFEIYTKSKLVEVGYNKLYIRVKDLNGAAVDNAVLNFLPMMDMGTMQHSCPTIQPTYNSTSKSYEGVSVFTMTGSWEFTVIINNGTKTFPVEVLSSPTGTKYVGSYLGTDEKKYFVSIVKPFNWKVGMNDVSIMVHKRSSMDSYTAIDNFTVFMDPQMTSMGHGSPNNVSPTSAGKGYYNGKANFTMTGDWRLNLDLLKAGDTIVSANIDILF